jgi:hypothetical protein
MLSPQVPFLMPLCYLPDVRFFRALKSPWFKGFTIDLPFVPKSLQQRCYLMGNHQVIRLSVSVKHQRGTTLRSALLDHTQSWKKDHLGAIKACYGKAPFFEALFPLLEEAIIKPHETLFSLQEATLQPALQVLGLWRPELYVYPSHKEQEWQIWQPEDILRMQQKTLHTDKIADFNTGNDFASTLSVYHLLFYKGRDSFNFI